MSEIKRYLSEIGKKGGQTITKAKTEACRANAAKARAVRMAMIKKRSDDNNDNNPFI